MSINITQQCTLYQITQCSTFASQSAAKFTSTQRQSKVTGKQETFYDIQNDAGYTFKMVTPPCNSLFPHLGEGGNFGGKFFSNKGNIQHCH